ncbi:MAG: DMT family transporter [Halobacterium sp.]
MVAVAVAIAAVSTSAILVRWSTAPSVVKAFYRVLFMTAAVAPFALRDAGDLRAISQRDLGFAAVSGLALAVHFASFFESLEWTTVAASVTLITTQPIFVGVGAAVLLDERLSARIVAGMAVALAGAFAMSVGPLVVDPQLAGGDPAAALAAAFAGSTTQLYGNALALAGAALGAVYTLAGRSLRQRLSLFTYTFVVYAVCTVALAAIAVGSGAPLTGYAGTEWALFLAMALLPGMFGHTVINWALKYVQSSVVAVSLLGEPVGSTLLALVLLGEVPHAVTVLGGAVVLAGIFVTTRARAT